MKQKISITIDKEVLDLVENAISSGKFRNRSHVLEYSVKKLIANEKKQDLKILDVKEKY